MLVMVLYTGTGICNLEGIFYFCVKEKLGFVLTCKGCVAGMLRNSNLCVNLYMLMCNVYCTLLMMFIPVPSLVSWSVLFVD